MPPVTLRYMRLADVPRVVAIDQKSFSTPWSANSYAYEVKESQYSHMLVVEGIRFTRPPGPFARRAWDWLTGQSPHQAHVLSYGGLWMFGQEGHISTIASHPNRRGQGWGELALVAMLRRATTLRAERVVLEVRLSNTGAQQLYRKYGFEVRGVKKGYYHDDKEDAYDMIAVMGTAFREHLESQYARLVRTPNHRDFYTNSQRPYP